MVKATDWREGLEYVEPKGWRRLLLAEDEHGDLLAPDLSRRNWWRGHYSARNPLHWLPWVLTRLTRSVVWVEAQ